MTYQQARREAEERFVQAGIPEAKNEAMLLLYHCCQMTATSFFMRGQEEMVAKEWNAYEEAIAKRCRHIPLQYITGEQDFMGLTFRVTPDVLIPRYDTECLVEAVLPLLHEGDRVLDMCTGSGCIITALMKLGPGIVGTGVDISEKALEVARENATVHGCEVTFLHSDLFDEVEGVFELIVSNPPYIRSAEVLQLEPEVMGNEPRTALDGLEDGLHFYRLIIKEATQYLSTHGYLCFEIGHDQAKDVMNLLEESGYCDRIVKKDLAGRDRVVIARKG
ncbi:release factor glutamine methyltransferase [Lachnospiraceae bacterium XBB1006]|nr:release factor glutamine methyltransferase [Lachnospiraceae bacterium XBB1006]